MIDQTHLLVEELKSHKRACCRLSSHQVSKNPPNKSLTLESQTSLQVRAQIPLRSLLSEIIIRARGAYKSIHIDS
jgi:hypothetical protein